MKNTLLALAAMATALHEAGAVRPEHAQSFASLRVAIDQAADKADEPAPAAAPGAPELADLASQVEQLRHSVEALAMVTDHTADQVASLAAVK